MITPERCRLVGILLAGIVTSIGQAETKTGSGETESTSDQPEITSPLRWTMDILEQGDDLKVAITDLNNHGQATGYITSTSWSTRPFIRLDSDIIKFQEVTSGYGRKINDAGIACGYGLNNLVFRFEESGPVPLAYVDNISSIFSNFELNEAGMICGSTSSGNDAFMWTPDEATELFNDFYIEDMDEDGNLVGETDDTAFVRRNGVVELLDGDRALSIDDADRVLVRKRHGSTDFEFTRHELDSGKVETVAYIQLPDANTGWGRPTAAANESGMVAIAWPVDNPDEQFIDQARLGFWTSETGLVEIEVPDKTHFVVFDHLTESGMIVGRALNGTDYENRFFVASLEHGFVELPDRMIGADDSVHIGNAVDINESGQIAVLVYGNMANAFYSVILTPARAGDADGDGVVDVTDLLLVISNWGAWPAGSPCGPDLNMDGYVDINDMLAVLSDWN